MTTSDTATTLPEVTEPTEPGWYVAADPRLTDHLIFLRLVDLDVPGVIVRKGAWMALTRDGESTPCGWGYIAQGGPVIRLVKEQTA